MFLEGSPFKVVQRLGFHEELWLQWQWKGKTFKNHFDQKFWRDFAKAFVRFERPSTKNVEIVPIC